MVKKNFLQQITETCHISCPIMSRNFFLLSTLRVIQTTISSDTQQAIYKWKKVQLCFFLLCAFFTSKSSFGRVVWWWKMLYSPNLYFFKLCKHSLYSVHTTQIPPKFFASSPPAIFHYTQEARTHQKCAKMSRNHVFLCHIDNVKNIKRDAAAKGEREKIAKTRQLIFFFSCRYGGH